ncbi:MAG: hypothetical protein WCH61_06330, partial [bacterium]
LGLSAFTAVKLASAGFFVAGLWPLARLLRRLVPAPLVGWGCLLYATNPQLVRFAPSGLLDPAKTFFLLWLAALLLAYGEQSTLRWRHIFGISLTFAGLALARAEGVFFLPLIAIAMIGLPVWQTPAGAGTRLKTSLQGMRDVMTVMLLAALLCLPQLLYVKSVTGTPALDSRQATKIQQLIRNYLPADTRGGHDAVAALPAVPPVVGRPRNDIPARDVVTPWRNFRLSLQGLDPFLLALAALAMVGKFRRRDWSCADTLCLAFILYNVALFASTGFIIKRYTMTTIPLVIGWAVLGAAVLKTRGLDRLHPALFPVVALGVLAVSAVSATSKFFHRDNPPRRFGQWLEMRRGEFTKAVPVILTSDPQSAEYHDGRQPLVAASTPQYAFWAAADWIKISHKRMYTPDELRVLIMAQGADLLVVDADLLTICPTFQPQQAAWLRQASDAPAGGSWTAYRIVYHPR